MMTLQETIHRLFLSMATPFLRCLLAMAMPKVGAAQSSVLKPTAALSLLTVSLNLKFVQSLDCMVFEFNFLVLLAWINTEIVLDVADPGYIDTLYKTTGVTGDMTTTDGGKTWAVTTINIPQYTF